MEETYQKELKRLSRTELLELMVELSKQLEESRKEKADAEAARRESRRRLEEARMIIADLRSQLKDRDARLAALTAGLEDPEKGFAEAGSIAEAAVAVSGILQAAQEAADRYLQAVYRQQTCSAQDRQRIEAADSKEAEAIPAENFLPEGDMIE